MSLFLAVVIVMVAGALAGLTGFGFSVLSVPLLMLVFPPHDVVLIALALVPLTSGALLLAPDLRGKVNLKMFLGLTGFSVLGLPIGMLVFERLEPMWVVGLTGVALVGYTIYGMLDEARPAVRHVWVAPSGILGGILATSTGLSGPAVAMYVHGRRLAVSSQIATMAAYVGAISVLGLGLLAFRGAVTGPVMQQVATLAPAAVVGVVAGRLLGVRWDHNLGRVTLAALGAMGLWTVARAVFQLAT